MPGQKRSGWKRIYNYRQWLERFEQHTKIKYDTDIGPLFKEEAMNGTEWEVKEEKIQEDFLWALGLETAHQIIQSENRNEPDKIKIDKLIKLYNRYYLPKRNTENSR